ncbi:serpentine type 7TM GPCR chemoreceptor srh domain-containing protein [Ditylenchus destructor]|uniref:Serpentine type 7TM GPCR chemoreceptor srh domain-containing protein n=1 Tax=Ditylenchus destructor TaxID=166010 RepID=A0AAD4QWF9_9BILA|nr:serpentine type 7TM GPCR chemoreceptor srh domain-containing protein [Ditylenchus destructor]
MCATSQTYAVIYRTASVYDKLHVLGRKSSIFMLILLQLLYTIPAIVATLFTFPGHEKSVEFIKENHPLMLEFFLTHSCTILGTEVSKIIPYIITAMSLISAVVVVNMVAVTMALRGLRAARGKMTQKTYRMHRQLTLSVVLQSMLRTQNDSLAKSISRDSRRRVRDSSSPGQFITRDNSSPATIHHLRQFITCDNSSPGQFITCDNSSPTTIHHLRQFITHKEKGPIFRKI